MDGPFYVDTKPPHLQTDIPAVTMSTTLKAIVPVGNLPVLPPNYWNWIGKQVRIRYWAKFTTGATPGNVNFAFLWGNGADNNGTLIQSQAYIMTANIANGGCHVDVYFRCRSLGTTGTLYATGMILVQTFGVATFPASNAGPSLSLDLTQSMVMSPQISRTGSTAESIQVEDFNFEATN